ncbi:MAG: fructosamine kinase family protein [Chitinophagaceae bacterium]
MAAYLKKTFKTDQIQIHEVEGGCINKTYKLTLPDNRNFFCKVNSVTALPGIFSAEKNGLQLLANQKVIKVPDLIGAAAMETHQVLILEWIDKGIPNNNFWKTFGERLALLHAVSNNAFGLNENNYMGSVPQSNKWTPFWTDFFKEQRLEPLVKQCYNKKLLKKIHLQQFEKIYQQLPDIFNEETPSLLHGDLWAGNFMCNENSEPVLIDPAVYYGHHSVDLAMTTLFGGFDKVFYDAYNYHSPFPENHSEQWAACNLYPLLIHLLLFGSSYLPQIQQTLNEFT